MRARLNSLLLQGLLLLTASAATVACSAPDSVVDTPITDTTPAFGEPVANEDPFGAVASDDPFAVAAPSPDVSASSFGDGEDARRQALNDAIEAARNGDIAQARADFRALQNDPTVGAWATHNLGVLATAENQDDQARAYFEQALDQNPALGDALVALIRPMLRAGDTRGASALVNRYLAASGNAPEIEAASLLVMLEDEQFTQVISAGRAVLLRQPENLDVHFAMAMAYAGLGQNDLGRYILNQALNRDGNRADIRYALAVIELEDGATAAAQSMFRQVTESNPYHVESWNNLGVLYMGVLGTSPAPWKRSRTLYATTLISKKPG